MLNTQQKIKFSEHAVLYDILIPKDNKYRLIDELIDFMENPRSCDPSR